MGRTGTLIIIGGIGGMGGRIGGTCCCGGGWGGGATATGGGGGATTTVLTMGSIGSGMRPFCLWIWAIWSFRLHTNRNHHCMHRTYQLDTFSSLADDKVDLMICGSGLNQSGFTTLVLPHISITLFTTHASLNFVNFACYNLQRYRLFPPAKFIPSL
jgi:hypothetical protein